MDKSRPTLAIYGIQDRKDYSYPFYVHDHNLAIMQNGEVISFLQQERISRLKRDNSSFNSKGKPIVHKENDALDEARNLKLDGVVINGKIHN